MRSDFTLSRGDTDPPLQIRCEDANGNPVSLDGASVEFRMHRPGRTVTGDATIVDPTNGVVRFDWGDGATDDDGRYLARFMVTFADGGQMSFPNDEAVRVLITPRIPT